VRSGYLIKMAVERSTHKSFSWSVEISCRHSSCCYGGCRSSLAPFARQVLKEEFMLVFDPATESAIMEEIDSTKSKEISFEDFCHYIMGKPQSAQPICTVVSLYFCHVLTVWPLRLWLCVMWLCVDAPPGLHRLSCVRCIYVVHEPPMQLLPICFCGALLLPITEYLAAFLACRQARR
jgi:hypothetical protein